MIKPQNQPNNTSLILILIGTTILAIPALPGTFALLDTSSSYGINLNDFSGKILFLISISGFLLFAGYILTAIFRWHSRIFWSFSMLYNLALSSCYWYLIFTTFSGSLKNFNGDLSEGLFLLVPIWTVFVTVASGYYLKFSLLNNKSVHL